MRKISIFILAALFLMKTFLYADQSTTQTESLKQTSPFETVLTQGKTSEVSEPKENEEQTERKIFNQVSKKKERIYAVPIREDVVFKLQTAIGYVSSIELPEPALKVYIGDQDLFKVGVYDTEILIKPITEFEGAKTNLMIVTEHHRLSFDILVGAKETCDFILNFKKQDEDVIVENFVDKKVEEKKSVLEKEYQEKNEKLDEKAEELSDQKLTARIKEENQIQLDKHQEKGEVRVNLISISKAGDKGFVKFGIRNLSKSPYQIGKIILGFETFEKTKLGLGKESKGITEIESSLELQNPIPSGSYEYGILSFDYKNLDKTKTPVLLINEEAGNRSFTFSGFKWIGEN